MNHDYLTRDMRLALRTAIDKRVRELLPDEPECVGCGRPLSDEGCTEGCKRCFDRRRRRARRRDPELHKLELAQWRAARRRRQRRRREEQAA